MSLMRTIVLTRIEIFSIPWAHSDKVINSNDIPMADVHFSSTPEEPDPEHNFSVFGLQQKKGFTLITCRKLRKGQLH